VRLGGLVSQQATTFVPFVDFNLFTEQHDVLQIYRHFEFILQEFYLKADKGFVFSLKDWYDAAVDNKAVRFVSSDHHDSILNASMTGDRSLTVVETNKDLKQAIEVDMCMARDIMEYADKKSGDLKQSAHILFDFVRLSPIVCNLSFSVNGTIHTDDSIAPERATDTIFNFFLESIGSTITEFKDVKFRFAAFKIAHDTKTWDELYFSVFDHYKIQALRQAYVLIFGLDVLGNPFGLVTDLSQGLTDLFYEPLIGYLSKDVKTLDIHMGQKVKSTVDKTISSAAGSASLITGSIGRILATCTFDKDFKRKRQYKLSKTSTMSLTDCFAIAGKGIIAGSIYGIAGLVQSPVKEARIGGFKGVFKGIGKGLTGFFTKPMSSVFDGVSITFDGIKRHSQSGDETVQQIRLPRHLLSNVAILPFSEYQSMGYEVSQYFAC
jgi:vacuolar protein sorting-associated protein 13A/C